MALGPLSRPELDFICSRIHVDPVHDGRLICDG